MKFIFADSHDYIDPKFDFVSEEYDADRRAQHDDWYPHEFFETPPYDGMLVSRATVGDERWSGKYSTSQSVRFRRDGAATYLRYFPRQNGGIIMGDCGAFSYVKAEMPLYSVSEMAEFYEECGFTHGVSVDHAILGYDEAADAQGTLFPDGLQSEWRRRWELTLALAEQFHHFCRDNRTSFVPIGVAQGWSPLSYASAVRRLVDDFGYGYVALGGMVPLKTEQIHRVLRAVRAVAPTVQLHLFGFTKAENISEFVQYNLSSFDSTSPMLRAFKDGTKNYLTKERWYTAIRIPQADAFRGFKHEILAGALSQRHLRQQEAAALDAVRRYDADKAADVDAALEPVLAYELQREKGNPNLARASAYRRTLLDRPWDSCPCKVCRQVGIEALIFRGSNRNRRRGFHNLWTFHEQLRQLRQETGQ